LVIVGASYGGVQTALSAREHGYKGSIRIICDETHLPYQRPPLSKGYLLGDTAANGLSVRSGEHFDALNIELMLGYRAAHLNCQSQQLTLADGMPVLFDTLVLATGSRARKLTAIGSIPEDIAYLRTLNDAAALKERLEPAHAIVIVGGGFIGLEVAAAAIKAGKTVTVLEAKSRLLERAVSPLVSQFLLDAHTAMGVDIRFKQSVIGIEKTTSRYRVQCSDGKRFVADLVVAGVGGIPNDELAREAAIECSNGIDVDEHGRTNNSKVFAVGDVSNHFSRFVKRRVRLESVQNAMDQGKAAGAFIAGSPAPYMAVPRFWSDQYDVKLQIVGLCEPTDRPILRGSLEARRFSLFYFRNERLVGVDSINRPGDQLIARRLIDASLSPTMAQAADLSFDLKQVDKFF
jgi:3-phenylpropionate/trans-cinnamate dioxygenase ferredoxin reductase subunit